MAASPGPVRGRGLPRRPERRLCHRHQQRPRLGRPFRRAVPPLLTFRKRRFFPISGIPSQGGEAYCLEDPRPWRGAAKRGEPDDWFRGPGARGISQAKPERELPGIGRRTKKNGGRREILDRVFPAGFRSRLGIDPSGDIIMAKPSSRTAGARSIVSLALGPSSLSGLGPDWPGGQERGAPGALEINGRGQLRRHRRQHGHFGLQPGDVVHPEVDQGHPALQGLHPQQPVHDDGPDRSGHVRPTSRS